MSSYQQTIVFWHVGTLSYALTSSKTICLSLADKHSMRGIGEHTAMRYLTAMRFPLGKDFSSPICARRQSLSQSSPENDPSNCTLDDSVRLKQAVPQEEILRNMLMPVVLKCKAKLKRTQNIVRSRRIRVNLK